MTNSKFTWMSKSTQNRSHLQSERLPLLLDERMRGHIYPVLPFWYLPPLSWSHHQPQAWPFRLGVWPTPTGKSCRGGNQGAKIPQTVTRWFFLLWASSGWLRSSDQLCHLIARYWLNQWEMTCFQTDQIMNRLSQILVWHRRWPACFIHYPFHHQPLFSQINSCHLLTTPLSPICLLVFAMP